jgi:hypothetical protein
MADTEIDAIDSWLETLPSFKKDSKETKTVSNTHLMPQPTKLAGLTPTSIKNSKLAPAVLKDEAKLDPKIVTNTLLMPRPLKLPGVPDKKPDKVLAPHLLGSGSKIPENYNNSMTSQLPVADTARFAKKKTKRKRSAQEDNWWKNEARVPMMVCMPYKGSGHVAKGSKKEKDKENPKETQLDIRQRQELAAKEKQRIKSEQTKLMGQKEAFLSQLCNNTTISRGDPEVTRVVGLVAEINKKLGLPAGHMGNWKLPGN